jgi:putative PIN family toxin of toxin-antitoxin system
MGWTGTPSRVVDFGLRGLFTMVTSRALLDELADVLQRPRLAEAFDDPLSIVVLIERMSVLVEPTLWLEVVTDSADNRVLEAAQAGHADFIVTGDSDLLDLVTFEGTYIVQSTRFLEILEAV